MANGFTSNNLKGQSISDIGSVAWGLGFNYLVTIDRIKSPFTGNVALGNVIPCYQVQEKIPLMKSMQVKLPMYGNFNIPIGIELPTLTVSLYDDENCIVEKSIKDWINDIFYTGTSIRTLDENTTKLTVFKLSSNKKITLMTSYEVYPEGDCQVTMGSNITLKELNVNFNVVYIYPREDFTV